MNVCDLCPIRTCCEVSSDDYPTRCPTYDEVQADAQAAYLGEDAAIAKAARANLKFAHGSITRVEETMAFAHISGYRKIGVAFCAALHDEARAFCGLLRNCGFAVESVICKNGSLPADFYETGELCTSNPEAAGVLCNPVGQALLMNQAGTDLNVVLGLCVGHDSLFIKHSQAPATYLVVKDHVLDHNPVQALRELGGEFSYINEAPLPGE